MLMTPENQQAARKFAKRTSSVTNTVDAIVSLPDDSLWINEGTRLNISAQVCSWAHIMLEVIRWFAE